MLNLNFDLYKGVTPLHDWWKEVKSHFTQVQNAHNDLENNVGEETERIENLISQKATEEQSARERDVNSLSQRILNEQVTRSSYDNRLLDLCAALSEKDANLERVDRLLSNKDSELQGNIDTNAGRITALENTSHTHANAAILNGITSSDIAHWNEKFNYDTENKLMLDFLSELLRGMEREIDALTGGIGIALYDGGFYTSENEADIALILDGGGFDEADSAVIDCGDFEINPYTAYQSVVDGGSY